MVHSNSKHISSSSKKSILNIRATLNSALSTLDSCKELCCYHPEKDFTRKSKISFLDVIRQTLTYQNKTLQNEMFQYYGDNYNVPTKSALIQQRHKIKPDAFAFLFGAFMNEIKLTKSYKGFRLLACDGSTVNIPRNPADEETSICANPNAKSYNAIHLNALYDISNKVYVDYELNNGCHVQENEALCTMISRQNFNDKTICIADRGYAHINLVAFLLSNRIKFVIRAKDIHSNGLLHSLNMQYPEEEFDISVVKTGTASHKKCFADNPDYFIISERSNAKFNYFDESGFFTFNLRIVRFKLPDGSYESIITNLDETFSTDDIKHIYSLRWIIETSFRGLKYDLNLVYFHGKLHDFIVHEVLARIIMFNFCSLITQCIPNRNDSELSYTYSANFAESIGICLKLLLSGKVALLSRLLYNMNPIRPDRKVPLGNLHDTKPSKSFNYRG